MNTTLSVLLNCPGETNYPVLKSFITENHFCIRRVINEELPAKSVQLIKEHSIALTHLEISSIDTSDIDIIIDASPDHSLCTKALKQQPAYIHAIDESNTPVIYVCFLHPSRIENIVNFSKEIHDRIIQCLNEHSPLDRKYSRRIHEKRKTSFDEATHKFYEETSSIADQKIMTGRKLSSRIGSCPIHPVYTSEPSFYHLINNAPMPYLSLDENGFIIEVNKAWLSLLGYDKDEVISKDFIEFLEDTSIEKFKSSFAKFKESGSISGVEVSLKKKTGGYIHASSTGRISYTEYGSFGQAHCIFQDITSLKQIEISLRQSEERYRRIIETANEGIWITDSNGIITFCNSHFARMLDYPNSDLIGKPLISFISPQWQEPEELFSDNGSLNSNNQEVIFIRNDGSEMWALLSVSNLTDQAHGTTETLGMVMDITKRKKFEEQLKQSRLHLSQLIDQRTSDLICLNKCQQTILSNIPSAVALIDKDLLVHTYNKMLEDMILNKNFIQGQKICNLFGCSKDKQKNCPVQESVCNLLSNDPIIQPIDYTIRQNHRKKLLRIRLSRITHNEAHVLMIIEDITHEQNMEKRLLVSERLAATGRLAASIAHEINSPLQGIVTHLELIKEQLPLNFTEMDSYDIIKDNLTKIRDIVRQLLDVYMCNQSNKNAINMNHIIKQVESIVHNQLAIKELALTLDLAPDLPEMYGYHQQLHQIILNIMLNAIDYTRAGDQIKVTTSATPEHITITITDSGPGIPQENLDHIFDPFFSSKHHSGAGLGLFVCQGLVKNHKGNISVDSPPGKGTTVTITFPLKHTAKNVLYS